MRNSTERGIAMITTLLVLMLISALLVGFTAIVMSDQRFRFIDRDRGQAFYAAGGALEKLTGDLGNTFFSNVAPTNAQVTAATAAPPVMTGVSYSATNPPGPLPSSMLTSYYCTSPNSLQTVGPSGYTIMFCGNPSLNPAATNTSPIVSGPYAGLVALQTPYQIDVTARTATGGEVHLIRAMTAVAIPVFQFGMFSDVDLSFFAGPNFNFGGRVHTNGNLFLAEGNGSTLTLGDKVTAVKDIIRQRLQNNVSIDIGPAHAGTVNMATAPGVYRALDRTEGSVTDGLLPSPNPNPGWTNISLSYYNSWIRNGTLSAAPPGTGAKPLTLPIITAGGTNPDLIRRPLTTELPTSVLFNERLFSKASLRILLSDNATDITSLPTVTGTAPVQLENNWNTAAPAGYGPVSGATGNPPIALSPGTQNTATTGASTAGDNFINANVTLYFQPQGLTVGSGATMQAGVNCVGRTFNTFTSCTANATGGSIVAGQPVTATVNGQLVSTSLALDWPNGGTTITVQNGETGRFAPNNFWLNGALVSCAGSNLGGTQFTNCAGVPNGNAGDTITTNVLSNVNTGLLGGFIKIEEQLSTGVWTDVTTQILNYGIGAPNQGGQICADPTPNAILRMERLRDNPGGTPTTNGGGCNYAADNSGYRNPTNWWPNVLFDPREALQRDAAPAPATNLPLGGVMHYLAIDTNNLAQWFIGTAPPYNAGTGASAKKDNGGFTVYFSDRRNNRNASNLETGEYGWEDFVNPSSPTGAPNGALDPGEDVNANTILDVYGGIPNYNGAYNTVPPGAALPLNATAVPTTFVNRGLAQVNRPILFRHALKLINGSNFAATGITGLTVVSENPVYLQGNWNAPGTFGGTHAATAIIADAVTLLSNSWTDLNGFLNPYNVGGRNRGTQVWYRVAIIGGKGAAFVQPAGTATDFGTDGGAHNFLRYLENGDQQVNYRGSIATFFYNRQGVGTYKCCATVYGAPTRNYVFDTDFLTPALLPPNTPVFRDMNAVGFSQELRPGK